MRDFADPRSMGKCRYGQNPAQPQACGWTGFIMHGEPPGEVLHR